MSHRSCELADASTTVVQLLAPKNCERPGVVLVEHKLTLNWPLLHEKGACPLEGERNYGECPTDMYETMEGKP